MVQLNRQTNDIERLKGALGAAVASARTASGMSLRELARVSGCGLSSLHKIECGATNPSFVQICRIASALGIDPGELVSEAWRAARRDWPQHSSGQTPIASSPSHTPPSIS